MPLLQDMTLAPIHDLVADPHALIYRKKNAAIKDCFVCYEFFESPILGIVQFMFINDYKWQPILISVIV